MTDGRREDEMDERLERIGDVLTFLQLALGALAYCLEHMEPKLRELGNDEALQRLEEAREAHEVARSIKYDWKQQKRQRELAREGAVKLDNEIDQTLSTLQQALEAFADLKGESERTRMAEELLGELFPSGVYPITSQSFDVQQDDVEELLERLRGPFAGHVQTLGVQEHVDQLAELNQEFGEKLDMDNDEISYDQVQAKYKEAEDAFHGLLVKVLSDYHDDMETLNEVLEPVRKQSKRARRNAQRRGGVQETDEPADPEGEGASPTDDSENNTDGETETDGG
jgi:hypothetical protein